MSSSKSYLDLPYVCGPASICAIGERAIDVLKRLGVMFGLDGTASEPSYPVAVTLTDGIENSPIFTEREFLDFHLEEGPKAVVSIRKDTDIGGSAFMSVCGRLLLTTVQEFQPSERIALHGALLEEYGVGIALLADSGVGKSTTLKRHNLNGGCGVSDDWLMVNVTQGGFVAQVLPTWSSILKGTATFFPVQHNVPLRAIGVVAHANGSTPRKESIDELEFFINAFNASEVFNRLLLKHLPGEICKSIRLRHIGMIDKIMNAYKPFKYFASLDDNPSVILFSGGAETEDSSAIGSGKCVSLLSTQTTKQDVPDCARQMDRTVSDPRRRCRLSDASVLCKAMDDLRAVLINAETGSMFMLNRTGLFVCQTILEKPRSVDEIVSVLGNIMRLPQRAAHDISALVGIIDDKGFLVWE